MLAFGVGRARPAPILDRPPGREEVHVSTDSPMSDVFEVGVVTFGDTDAADRVVGGLRDRGATHLVNDVAVLEHHDSGRFSTHSYSTGSSRGERTGAAAVAGAFVGALFGPLGLFVGLVGGGAVGASMGGRHAHELGLSDEFVQRLRDSLPPGSSAVVLIGEPDRVDELVSEIRAADAVTTNEFRHPLSEEKAAAIRAAIEAGKGGG
jgi:uncharacterized membrane protein